MNEQDERPRVRPPYWLIILPIVVYFGVKYLVFGGDMDTVANITLFVATLLLSVFISQWWKSRSM